MTNREIYRKTLPFSLRRAGWDILAFLAAGALTAGGILLGDRIGNGSDRGAAIGLIIGVVLGLVVLVVMLRFNGYMNKAAQIAMITRGVTEDSLPEDVVRTGKQAVKERFSTVAGYYLVTGVIRGIFNQLGKAISGLGRAVGGDTGEAVGDAVNTAVNTVIRYLCDCCLGWVFYRSDRTAPKATLEGAAIFFKHGKTLLKNMGRVFGFALVSLLVIGGVFGLVAYVILQQVDPVIIGRISEAFTDQAAAEDASWLVKFLADPGNLTIGAAALAGFILWSILHSVFIRPYVLVGVLRNFMASGIADQPTEADLARLDGKSEKFRKLRAEAV